MKSETVSKDRILQLMEWKEDGLYWKPSGRRGHRNMGKRAGYVTKQGYRIICIDYKDFFEHNLVWFLATGCWPVLFVSEIDHINRNKSDNRLVNLRTVTRTLNNANMKIRSDNSSGFRGVYFDKSRNKFVAQITNKGKTLHLGRFDNAADAAGLVSVWQEHLWGGHLRQN